MVDVTTPIVDREEWIRQRRELLVKEKEFVRRKDKLATMRRGLPRVRVDKDFRFETEGGEVDLEALFDGCGQLAVYHFMYAGDWDAPCKSCSFWADNFDGVDGHLRARDVKFACVSAAPLSKLLAWKEKAGWRFDWVSAVGPAFNEAFGVGFYRDPKAYPYGYNYSGKPGGEEMPGLSVFMRDPSGAVFHTYSTYSRGLELLNGAYQMLDMTPAGRAEEGLAHTMAWVKYRFEY